MYIRCFGNKMSQLHISAKNSALLCIFSLTIWFHVIIFSVVVVFFPLTSYWVTVWKRITSSFEISVVSIFTVSTNDLNFVVIYSIILYTWTFFFEFFKLIFIIYVLSKYIGILEDLSFFRIFCFCIFEEFLMFRRFVEKL